MSEITGNPECLHWRENESELQKHVSGDAVALATAKEVEFFCGCWLANVASSRNLPVHHLLKPAPPRIGWTTTPIATRSRGKGSFLLGFIP